LVLCPTRELCTQVARDIRKLGRREAGLQVLIVSGGQPINPQLTALKQGVHVVVGTPGRVLDHLKRSALNLTGLTTLVVDEADRMLEMGFADEMEKILSDAPVDRQTVFFSATYPRSIEKMSNAHQRHPVRLTIAESAGPRTRQLAYDVGDQRRLETLLSVLRADPPESALVFCNLKATGGASRSRPDRHGGRRLQPAWRPGTEGTRLRDGQVPQSQHPRVGLRPMWPRGVWTLMGWTWW